MSYCMDVQRIFKSMEYHLTCWILQQQFELFSKQVKNVLLFAFILGCKNFNRKQNQVLEK